MIKQKFSFFAIALVCLVVLSVQANAISRNDAVNWAKSQVNRTGTCDVDGNGLWCTDLATAYINYCWLRTNNDGRDPWCLYPYTTKNAKDYDNYLSGNNNWKVISRTSSTAPEPGDLFVSESDSYGMGVGHVGIVLASYGNTQADIIEMSEGRKPNIKSVTWGSTASYYAEHFIRFNFFESDIYTGAEMSKGAGQTIPDGDYEIVCAADPNYELDIAGDSVPTTNEMNVDIWTRDNPARVQDVFTVTYQNNGFYIIKQKGTNLCLDVRNAGTGEGENVQMFTSHSTPAQLWSIARMDTEDKSYCGYSLQPKCSGLYLDISGGLAANDGKFVKGQNIQQWRGNNSVAQCWLFVPYKPAQPISNGRYILLSGLDNSYELDVSGDSTNVPENKNVQIWKDTCDSRYNSFDITKQSDGYYTIVQSCSGKYLEVTPDAVKRGQNIVVHSSNGAMRQFWAITKSGSGYTIRA